MEGQFIIDGPQPGQDLSYVYIEKNKELTYIQKGVELAHFRENMNKRNFNSEFNVLRRLTENPMYLPHFREYNSDIAKLDRYDKIVPFKHTMVKLPSLTVEGGEQETYINANYITSSKITDHKAFIATQGPLESTRKHFWRMIWHNDVKLIVMLCKFKEDGRIQCDQYWKPEAEELELDNYKVALTSTERTGNLTKRVFTIKYIGNEQTGSEEKSVTHYQWTGWQDHGTPLEEDANVIDKLLDLIYQERTTYPDSPVVIHCSAGIGRSGTLIAIYNLELILRENLNNLEKVKLSVFGIVRRLREQRWGMVNTSDQYVFIYKLMADRIDKYMKSAEVTKLSQKPQE